ncbi:hypothetical protein IFR05_014570 [Cadophora sp. M221]|nr:hypothetical protein IFR05_014570 [Cadophora sp. M221]
MESPPTQQQRAPANMGSGTGTARRPACSRCLDDNVTCVYTSARRKPGPAKGFKRATAGAKQQQDILPAEISTPVPSTASQEQQNTTVKEPSRRGSVVNRYEYPLTISSVSIITQLPNVLVPQPFPAHSRLPEAYAAPYSSSSTSQPHDLPNLLSRQIIPEQSRQILESFFIYVHPSVYLFDKQKLMKNHEQGTIDGYLFLTILAITSHVQGLSSLWINPSLKSCLEQLLAIENFKVDHVGDSISLSQFQQAFLLAFYGFHQYPGRKSWLRVSELTREAYEWGLHQIDNPDQCQLYANNPMNVDEKEEWRRLWWSIYCLDSYCNITARTPYVIELDCVRTALISSDPMQQNQEAVFLPMDTGKLWETCQVVSERPGDYYVNVHILTTTVLREAGKLLRLWAQNPVTKIGERCEILDEHFSAVRLALPPQFFNVSRNVVHNETPAEHHARLICILHMHITRLLVMIPRTFSVGEERWRQGWTASLECLEDVVLIVRHWKAELCPSVDPAICFIISAVLMLIHLHSIDIANAESPTFLVRLCGQKELLRLFIEQFALIWHLPRFLTVSFDKFEEMFPGPLTAFEIAGVIAKMGGPLNQVWMRLLSLTSDHLKPPEAASFDLDLSMLSDIDFGNWDFWPDILT